MSYHNTSSAAQSTTNTQGETAPTGYHYMPDGSLMSDVEHARLYGTKIINSFGLDLNDIKATGESRRLTISGDDGAVFSLEIRSAATYYNFQTKLFQATRTKLDNVVIADGSYHNNITFPTLPSGSITTTGVQYDFYLTAEGNTKHSSYNEVRFGDGAVDINSSTGSNSDLMQKVIYQTPDVTVTINGSSAGDGTTISSFVNDTIVTSRSKKVSFIPFSTTVTVTTGSLSIDRQPTADDITAFVTRAISASPIDISRENIYPGVVGGTPSPKTVAVDHTGGATLVTMDDNVADIMLPGDKITGTGIGASQLVTVTNITDGGVKQFRASDTIIPDDGDPLVFTNRENHRWHTSNIQDLQAGMKVKAITGKVPPNTYLADYLDQTTIFAGEANEYKVDNVRIPSLDTLSLKPTISRNATSLVATKTQPGNIAFDNQCLFALGGTNIDIYGYGTSEVNRLYGYDVEFKDLKVELNTITTTSTALSTSNTALNVTSKVGIAAKITQTVNGATENSRHVVLDSVTGLGIGQSLYAGTNLVGTPTITAIDETNKKITLSSVQTFANDITLTFPNSIVSGIGIDPSVVNPYVDTIGSASSLVLTLSAAQTLENAQTFTFTGSGSVATISGSIKINKVGNTDVVLGFDVDNFLTYKTNA